MAQPAWTLQGCFTDSLVNGNRAVPYCVSSGSGASAVVVSTAAGPCAWGYSSAQCQATALALGYNTFALQYYGVCMLCSGCAYAALGATACPVAYPTCDVPGGNSGGSGNCGGARARAPTAA